MSDQNETARFATALSMCRTNRAVRIYFSTTLWKIFLPQIQLPSVPKDRGHDLRYHLCTSLPRGKDLSECRKALPRAIGRTRHSLLKFPVWCAAPNRIQTAALSLSQQYEVSLCRAVQLTGVLLCVDTQNISLARVCQVLCHGKRFRWMIASVRSTC